MADERARWIWHQPPPAARDSWGELRDPARDHLGHLRTTFSLAERPASARCLVTCDGRYELWVNGRWIGRGPARSHDPTYDVYDVADALAPGTNVVAALVRHYGRPTLWWRPSAPHGDWGYGAFALSLEAYSAGSTVRVQTGPKWRARHAAVATVEPAAAGTAFVPPPTEGPPPLEIVDGAGVPEGWTHADFDDGEWADAYIVSSRVADWNAMRARDVPLLVRRTAPAASVVAAGRAEPDTHPHPLAAVHHDRDGATEGRGVAGLTVDDGTWITFDFGSIVHGHPVVSVTADPGTVVDLACGEDLASGGKPVTAPREWAMRVCARGGEPEMHESFEATSFRYLSVAARGGSVSSIEVAAAEVLAPRAPGASFSCSDPLLERIYAAGIRTVDLCSTDALIDCPGREQRAWLGDAYLTSLIRLVIDPDPALVAGNLRLHARGQRPDGLLPMVAAGDFSAKHETIPDHSLLWIAGLHAFHERTGDAAIVEELVPVAARALAWFERHRGRDGGLANVPGWVFIDWAQLERTSELAALDAMHVWALERFAALCDVIEDAGSAGRARARAARTRAAFDKFWDERRGVYVDAAGTGAKGRVSQQTNVMAIVAGCAPRERWDRMLARVLEPDRLVRTLTPGDPGTFAERMNRQWQDPPDFHDEENVVLAQPFFTHFVHAALVEAGRAPEIVGSIRRWEAMLARGNGCFEEYWDAEPGLGSRCHAWSSTPVFDLATTVLGVRPAEPGMRSIVVEPCLGDLEWAQGSIATPQGFVRVAARAGERPEVVAPDGVRVVASAPR